MKLLSIAITLFLCQLAICQNENSTWYFGTHSNNTPAVMAGIQFNNGSPLSVLPPTAVPQGYDQSIVSGQGSSVFTNSDGITVLSNGADLYQIKNSISSKLNTTPIAVSYNYGYGDQSTIIIEDPTIENNLYVVHNDLIGSNQSTTIHISYLQYNSNTLSYTFSGVVRSFESPVGEFSNSLSATYRLDNQGNKVDAWIVKSTELENLVILGGGYLVNYFAFSLLNPTLIVQSSFEYTDWISNPNPPILDSTHRVTYDNGTEFNKNGNLLISHFRWGIKSFLLNFDNVTGTFGNLKTLNYESGARSAAFTSDGGSVLLVVGVGNTNNSIHANSPAKVLKFDSVSGNLSGSYLTNGQFSDITLGVDDNFYLSPSFGNSGVNFLTTLNGQTFQSSQINYPFGYRFYYGLPETSLFFEPSISLDCDCNDFTSYAENLLNSIEQYSTQNQEYDCDKFYFLARDWKDCYAGKFAINWGDGSASQPIVSNFNNHVFGNSNNGSYLPSVEIQGCSDVVAVNPIVVNCPEPCNCESIVLNLTIEQVPDKECTYEFTLASENSSCFNLDEAHLFINSSSIARNNSGSFTYTFLTGGTKEIRLEALFSNSEMMCENSSIVEIIEVDCKEETECDATCNTEEANILGQELVSNLRIDNCHGTIEGFKLPNCYEAFVYWGDRYFEAIPQSGSLTHYYNTQGVIFRPSIIIRNFAGSVCFNSGFIEEYECDEANPNDSQEKHFFISQNPVKDRFKVFSSDSVTSDIFVEIIDMNGLLISSSRFSTGEWISSSLLKNGRYILRISNDENEISVLNIIKE